MLRFHSMLSASVFVLGAAVFGCGGNPPAETTTPTGGQTSAAEGQRDVQLTPDTPATGETCELRTLYFGYDDSVLDQPSKDAITAAVECYRRNGAPANLRLTGATDPRGTEEYNLALGERRAQSVRSYLVSLGVDGAKIKISHCLYGILYIVLIHEIILPR
jgi:peptidoglycan-associated lipoprotein